MSRPDRRRTLRTQAYGNAEKLEARQALWRHTDRVWESGRINWATPLRGDETIVDVGCGNGRDLIGLRRDGHTGPLVAVDFSEGMLATVPEDLAVRLVGDATSLPLADDFADVVCAMHMLYHVEDIPAALDEARRVLRKDGTFLASTNSNGAMRELIEPWSAAMVEAGGPPLERVSHARFSVEEGGQLLRAAFPRVELKRIDIEARVPDASVIRDYVASTDDLYRPMLPDQRAWEDVVQAVERHARTTIERDGVFVVHQRAGVFVCRP